MTFPEWPIVGIIQYEAFSNMLFSLSRMHFSFLQASSWLDSSFFLALNTVSSSACAAVHSSTLLKDVLLLLGLAVVNTAAVRIFARGFAWT